MSAHKTLFSTKGRLKIMRGGYRREHGGIEWFIRSVASLESEQDLVFTGENVHDACGRVLSGGFKLKHQNSWDQKGVGCVVFLPNGHGREKRQQIIDTLEAQLLS